MQSCVYATKLSEPVGAGIQEVGSEWWTLSTPIGGLFVGVGEFQNGGFAEGFSQKLEADWEFRICSEAAGDADAANAGEVAGNGEDVGEVHLQRVAGFFADLKG